MEKREKGREEEDERGERENTRGSQTLLGIVEYTQHSSRGRKITSSRPA